MDYLKDAKKHYEKLIPLLSEFNNYLELDDNLKDIYKEYFLESKKELELFNFNELKHEEYGLLCTKIHHLYVKTSVAVDQREYKHENKKEMKSLINKISKHFGRFRSRLDDYYCQVTPRKYIDRFGFPYYGTHYFNRKSEYYKKIDDEFSNFKNGF